MKQWLSVIAVMGLAWAQQPAAAPVSAATLYDRLAPLLDQVRSLQGSNPSRARELLQTAENRFRESANALPPVLSRGIAQSLDDAQTSLNRRSSADLEARLGLIRAILGKAMYDNLFEALTAGRTAQATNLLPRVLAASGLPGSLRAQGAQLAAAKDVDGLRRLLERTYAQGINNALQAARGQTSPTQAFVSASRAYSLYLIVQDSPRARGLNAQAFVDALGKLSGGDLEAFKGDLGGLIAQAQDFLKATAVQTSSRPQAPVQAQNPPASGGVRVATPPPAPVAAAAKPAPAQPAVVARPAAAPEPQRITASVVSSTLAADLQRLLQNPQQARQVSQTLSRQGITSLEGWREEVRLLQGQLAEAQVRSGAGDSGEARRILGEVSSRYRAVVQPLVAAVAPGLTERTDQLLSSAQGAVGLRGSDFGVMSAEMLENSLALGGQSLGGWHTFQVGLTQTLMGLPKALLFVIAALLVLFPLYLLTLTFGGRNLYWRYLGVAFFLLLLPAMLEGLSYLGSILSDPEMGGLVFFTALTQLSIQQNPVAQLFWVLAVFVAAGLTTLGLRGIAAQFGLIQRKSLLNPGKNPTLAKATGTGAATGKPNPGLTSETIVEWDEEF